MPFLSHFQYVPLKGFNLCAPARGTTTAIHAGLLRRNSQDGSRPELLRIRYPLPLGRPCKAG